jgi:hypothetical protein
VDEESPSTEAEAKGKPSQVPSWVTLGFALGALFVMALPKHAPDIPVPSAPEPPAVKAAPQARVTTIEAVFNDWGHLAQWTGSTTQVGLWDPGSRSFADFFEVLRVGDALYFRSIPALTRPPLKQGIPQECPLEFAEAGRNDAVQAEERADMGAISKSIRESFGPTELPKPANPK